MHVTHVVRQFHPAVGGLENAVASLATSLGPLGVTSSIVTLDRQFRDPVVRLPPDDVFNGMAVTRVPYRGSTRYPLAPSVIRALGPADIVHVHAIDFFFDYMALTRLIHQRPLVASTHGGFFHTGYASKAKELYFASVTRASALAYRSIIASSESDARRFAEIAPSRTVTIENGVDVAKWRDAASRAPVPTMIFIGRFSVNKDIPALFPILARLSRSDADWRLIIAGVESDLTAADLHSAAARAGVSDRVEFHVGADDATLHALAGRASYVVSASRYEGFGLSAVEGLSAGLTPLLNRIPPFERLVESTGQGGVFDAASPEAAAAAIVAIHRSLGADYKGQRARNIAAADGYSWSGVAQSFAAEYRRVLLRPTGQ